MQSKLFYIYLGICLFCYIKLVIGLFSKEAEVKILEMRDKQNIKMSINIIRVLIIIIFTLLFLFNPIIMLKSK